MKNENKERTKVSIIMPLYNASRYLKDSLDSILSQSFREFELICINDASVDDTCEIIESYDDKRIRLLSNLSRKGAAYSRNKGIDNTLGDYILFLDGDDLFEIDLIEKTYNTAICRDADIVFYNYGHFDNESILGTYYSHRDEGFYTKYAQNTFSFRTFAEPEMLSDLSATCNKLYRRDYIISNNIRFQDLPRQNDVLFSYVALLLCDKVIALNDDRMMVRARDHCEPSRISNTKNPIYTFYAMKGVLEELENRGIIKEVVPRFYYVIQDILIGVIKNSSDEEQGREYYRFLINEGIPAIKKICGYGDFEIGNYAFLREKCFLLKYSSLWWKYGEPQWIDCLLHILKSELIDFFKTAKEDLGGVALWGCGEIGRHTVKFLDEQCINLSIIIDNDPQMWGKEIYGHVISNKDAMDEGIGLIIISSRKINTDEIKKQYSFARVVKLYDVLLETLEKHTNDIRD